MNMSQPITCAIIGLGRIASLLEEDSRREKPCTHAGAIADNRDCRLVAGCDIDSQRRQLFRQHWNCEAVFADAARMLAHIRPDLVVVATHADSHRSMVELAAASGVRVIICEKPLAHKLSAARRILELQRRGDACIVVNHERRYSRDYLAARDIIRSRRFGRLIAFRGALYYGSGRRHDLVLLHDGTHMVDCLAFLIESPLDTGRVVGTLRSQRRSVYIHAQAGECPGVIEVGAERDHLLFEIELSFERGRLTIGNGLYRIEESHTSPYYEGFRSLVASKTPVTGNTNYFRGMLSDAVACARDRARRPCSSAEEAYAALRFIHRASQRVFG